ncbi:MAG: ABC transporter permease, partial [Ktedonobacteraceae bacterium]|nr:ABC transporter permease [Ktedonobacteraceae bacterium]
MIQLFGISLDTFASILAIIALVIVGGVLVLALGNRLFFKLGVRNIPRRRTQMVLIVFALMLSTTLLSAVLETGNVITSAVRSVAVFNLGSVDEVITGGRGGFFSESVYHQLIALKQQNPDIAAIGAALEEGDLLVADNTSRQVRSKVTGLGIIPDSEIGFGGMQRNGSNETLRISTLPPDTVYLNQTLAQLLNAHPGDTLSLYARRWPGKRFTLQVQDIVSDGGLVGGKPYLLTHVNTFRQIEQRPGTINHIYVANRSSGGVSSVDLSDQVTTTLYDWLPRRLHVEQVKAEGVENSEKAQAIFVRIFALFCLFSLAIGLLLIFLIFVLLAAERRAEMGMARAIGVKRRHLILMFIFEGAVYDLLASFVGLAIGAGLGALAVNVLKPTLARFGFPLALSFQPRDLVIALCLGVIFTFCAVFLSSWLVSRMTIVQALRNLPEEERSSLSTGDIVQRLAFLVRQSVLAWRWRNFAEVRSILLEMIPDVLIHLVRLLFLLGLLPFLAGVWLFSYGLRNAQIIPFSLGLSLLIIGVGLFVKTCLERVLFWFGLRPQRLLYRLFATVVGLSILAYWALPF